MQERARELVVSPEVPETYKPAASVFDLDPQEFAAKIDLRETNRQRLLEWIREHLVDGTPRCYPAAPAPRRTKAGGRWVDNPSYDPGLHAMQTQADFGRVWTRGGWSKPGLFKSGAEKIWGRLGVVPHWPALREYELAAVEGRDIRNIVLRCLLIDPHGKVQSEGCGARSVQQDEGDLNKAIKMAKKSAAIDAVLAFGGLSEIFTQDVDDETEGEGVVPKRSTVPPAATADEPGPEGEPEPQESKPHVPAYVQQIGFGKYKAYTWKELVEGGSDVKVSIGGKTEAWCARPASVGGGRYGWLDWLVNKIESSENKTALDKKRLEYAQTCKRLIEERNAE